jgi:predicted TIM-barrel fold metal-dependent hydrolase
VSLGDYEVIDAHIHYGTNPAIAKHLTVPYLRYDDPEGVERCLDHYGIDRAVLLPPDRMLNPPRDVTYHQANEAVARAAERLGNRIIGAMRINPLFGPEEVGEEIRYFVEERGLRGIKLYPRADFYSSGDLGVMAPVMESAERYDIPVLFHSGHAPRDLPSLQAYTAKHYPKVRVIIAHIGLHEFLWEAIIAAKELGNVYVDMSQAWPFDIKAFVREVGAQKMLYGSDAPFQSPKVEQLKILECGFAPGELRQIFSENAKRVWGFA